MTWLVLAFDADCATCRAVARAVSGTVGDALEVLPLADYRVVGWCADAGATGDTPTLLEITLTEGDDQVRAWTGPALAPALVRSIGPLRALHLARALQRGGVGGAVLRAALTPR